MICLYFSLNTMNAFQCILNVFAYQCLHAAFISLWIGCFQRIDNTLSQKVS